jgi:hypothetical protein
MKSNLSAPAPHASLNVARPRRETDPGRVAAIVDAAAGLSLTEAGTGQDPAGDLVPITPEWLAARLQRGVAA